MTRPVEPGPPGEPVREIEAIEVDALVESIYARYGYDLRGYTRSSVQRRALHAVRALGASTVSELQGRVLRDPALFSRLVSLLTISVTELFRDPGFFAAVRAEVVPYLRTFPSRKLWVAGCSTGEEVLSLSILLAEEGLLERTLIYATDIDPASLETARRGVYARDVIQGYTQNYLRAGGRRSLVDYYTADYDAVLFHPHLLERVVFAEHSLATDAVFSEVQLVTCRNVLIYFDRELQDRALGLFADALPAGGFMGLGDREGLSGSVQRAHFSRATPDHGLFRKR